jgi:cation diffusion facilitator family transporter
VINLVWALVLIRFGRAWKSPALVAGGKHIMTDVWTTLGVLGGFALVPITGWIRLDPLVAGFVALNIIWADYGVLRESAGALMDEVIDPDLVPTIRLAISSHADGAIEAHDIRSRTAGPMMFVEFHLVVPANMTVQAAHGICDRFEEAIRQEIGRAVINGKSLVIDAVDTGLCRR